MVGNAVTTTRASRATMKKATEVSAIVQRGCEVGGVMPSKTLAAVETQRSAGVVDRQPEQRHQARIDERRDLRDGATIQAEHEDPPGAERLRLGVQAVD